MSHKRKGAGRREEAKESREERNGMCGQAMKSAARMEENTVEKVSRERCNY